MSITAVARDAVVGLGSRLPARVRQKLSGLAHDIDLTAWMRDHHLTTDTVVDHRARLYEIVAEDIGDQPVCYLEFGVAAGDATRIWSRLLTHPDTVLHGFDTFEGLPEPWTHDEPRGKYSQDGKPPMIDDPRVAFFTGLFEQTLPTYTPPLRDHYILNMDADLYSSTIYVLRQLRHLMRPGTYLYFDEFASPGHEERALREFVEETAVALELVASTRGSWHMLFRVCGPLTVPQSVLPSTETVRPATPRLRRAGTEHCAHAAVVVSPRARDVAVRSEPSRERDEP